ncbi:MAG TPA: hypothetical protein DHV29_03935 [Bacteroidales bacterium]|nr:hypothetical protein [Bacteroidales bacterium]HCY22623.1 hypothetical protein [Bacteroidales bacterium]
MTFCTIKNSALPITNNHYPITITQYPLPNNQYPITIFIIFEKKSSWPNSRPNPKMSTSKHLSMHCPMNSATTAIIC